MLCDAALRKLKIIRQCFSSANVSNDGINVAVTCPFCDEHDVRKKKLVIRLSDDAMHCWKCGFKSRSLARLFKRLKRYDLVNQLALIGDIVTQRNRDHQDDDRVQDVIVDPSIVLRNAGFRLLSHCCSESLVMRRLFTYARARGLTVDIMRRFKIGVCFDDLTLRGRIVVPSFDRGGHVNYYVARSIDDYVIPKYVNAHAHKNDIVFNECDILWDRELMLVEGIFDLMRLGCDANATCILGSTLSINTRLFSMIVDMHTPIVLALDSDAQLKQNAIATMLHSYGISVRAVMLNGHHDVGSMDDAAINALDHNAQRWTPDIGLKAKINAVLG